VVAAAAILAASATSADCGRCHPDHAREWAASPHARSARSPLFSALELLHRADRARQGHGDDRACRNCHGEPDEGIACVTCHAVADVAVEGRGLADMTPGVAGTFYGPIEQPAEARVHASVASALHRDERICAPCHDHETGAAPCCTTLRDWSASAMADFATCQSCHMRAVAGRQAARDGPSRTIHRHRFPGSDDLDQLRSGWDAEIRSASVGRDGLVVVVAVTNRAAHALPNGEPYGARVVLRARALDGRDRPLASAERAYGFEMLDVRGEPTVLPSRAQKRGASSALAAGETRQERFVLDAPGAAALEVTMWHVPFEPPAEARAWIDDLRGWMAKEKPDWAQDFDRLGAVFETRARPRLFARLVRSL
jgi:hypothetical protein